MNVAWDESSLAKFLGMAADVSPEHPVVISKFIENSKEIEIDAVAKRGKIIYNAITEHIENAGCPLGRRHRRPPRPSGFTSRRFVRSGRSPKRSPKPWKSPAPSTSNSSPSAII